MSSASPWAGQIRARGSEGILTRLTIKPQRLSCSSALMPAYSLWSVEGSCQQGEIKFSQFLSPPKQAHGDKETRKEKDGGVSTPRENTAQRR